MLLSAGLLASTVHAQAFVANWLQSFKEFPPRQTPASFSIDQVMEQLSTPPSDRN